LAKVRNAGIRAEIYPDSSKMKKQMGYANSKNIPFVAIIGEDEMAKSSIMLKDMEKGDQLAVTIDELIEKIK
jgi:histidyl-tRNA synthetase